MCPNLLTVNCTALLNLFFPVCSVQFSCSVMSDSLWPHGLQHARLPCPSPTPGAYSKSCPLSQWCHPTISSSVIPFLSCLQSFPASGSFPVGWCFASGGQRTGASASASVLPMNIQGWCPLGLTVWSPWCPRDSQESSPALQFEDISSSVLFYGPALTSTHHYWKKPQLWLYGPLQAKQCLCFLICCLRLSLLFFQGASIFGTSGKELACQCRRRKTHRFDPWVGKVPCRRKW